jgi:hypothetical protein
MIDVLLSSATVDKDIIQIGSTENVQVLPQCLINVAGAPDRPKGITRLSYRPKRVRKAVRYSWPAFIRMLLKAAMMSILEKYLCNRLSPGQHD